LPVISLSLHVEAPIDRVFDLSRSIELHIASTSQTRERAVGKLTSGLLGLDDEVTWEGRHLGVRQRLTTRISAYDRPSSFTDSMVDGAFARFDHRHDFRQDGRQTRIDEIFDYTSPLGPLGRLADALFLKSYMKRFLAIRLEFVKSTAESDNWPEYLPTRSPPLDPAGRRVGIPRG
jgi:ligand-binding SRPBCC domain-containing protein